MAGVAQPGTQANAVATFLNPRVTSLLVANQQAADAREKQEREKQISDAHYGALSRGMEGPVQIPKIAQSRLLAGASPETHRAGLLQTVSENLNPAPLPTGKDRYHVGNNGMVTDLFAAGGPERIIEAPATPQITTRPMTAQERLAHGVPDSVMASIDSTGKPIYNNKPTPPKPEKPLGAVARYERDRGRLPAGMTVQVGPNGELTAAPNQELRQAELEKSRPGAISRANTAIGNLDQSIGDIDYLLSDDAEGGLGDITGFGGTATGDFLTVAGGEGAKARSYTDRLEAAAFINQLQEMRDASPTGGAVGQVTEREIAILKAAAARLDRRQSLEDYQAALRDYKTALENAKRNIQKAYEREYGESLPSMGDGGAEGWSIVEVSP